MILLNSFMEFRQLLKMVYYLIILNNIFNLKNIIRNEIKNNLLNS